MNTRRPARANAITRTAPALLGLGLGLGMLAGCTSGGSGTAPSAAPSLSASGLLSAARAALRSGGAVHVDITDSSPSGSVAFSDDSTSSGGRQVITLDGTGHATILLIDGTDYVLADVQALEGFFQATQAQADQAADLWVSLRPGEELGTSTYDEVTAGITLSSVAGELQMSGTLSKTAPATVAGQPVIGVQAPVPAGDGLPGARLVLYVTDNAALRPVRYELAGGGSTANEFSFSRWGERLSLTAPAKSIPASSISAGSVNA